MSEFKHGRINKLITATVATALIGTAALTACARGEGERPNQPTTTQGTANPEQATKPAEKLATPEDARENFDEIAGRIMWPAQSQDQYGMTITLGTNSQIYKSAPHPQVTLAKNIEGTVYKAHAEFFDLPPETPLENLYYRDADRLRIETFNETPEGLQRTYWFAVQARDDGHTWMQSRDQFGPGTERSGLSAVTDAPHAPTVALTDSVMDAQFADALNILNTMRQAA